MKDDLENPGLFEVRHKCYHFVNISQKGIWYSFLGRSNNMLLLLAFVVF